MRALIRRLLWWLEFGSKPYHKCPAAEGRRKIGEL